MLKVEDIRMYFSNENMPNFAGNSGKFRLLIEVYLFNLHVLKRSVNRFSEDNFREEELVITQLSSIQ